MGGTAMTGHIRRRSEHSWELKFDLGTDPLTGKRVTKYRSFQGTKKAAQLELAKLIARADDGTMLDPSKTTLAEFLDRWESWAATQVSAKTLERYSELLRHQVRPHLGATRIQKLRAVNFVELYGKLQQAKPEGAGLAPRTIGHVHRLMHRVMNYAVKWDMLRSNPVSAADPPRVERAEIEILDAEQIKTVLHSLRGHVLYPVIVLALATGARRGELVALRWGDIDLDTSKVRIERSLEQTNAGLSVKAPKTKAGRRVVTVPASIAAELRKHWRQQQEQRLLLGLGKATPDDLVFARPGGVPWPPDALTGDWARAVRVRKLPRVTLHALRHTHVSQLIACGLDVVTVSRRIGHSNPTVTLGVYAHLFGNTDERAAEIVDQAMTGILAE
jgi:integrase